MKFRLVEENQYSRNKKQLPTFSHADLLTLEEAEKVPRRLRSYIRWWLRSPGYHTYTVAAGDSDGYFDYEGYIVYRNDVAVRPALRITNLGGYKAGSLFKFGGVWFQIIDENTAFCLSRIGNHRFDAQTNDYEKSEIKQYIDDWFSENIQKIKQ